MTELTLEQDLRLRNTWDALNKKSSTKKDIITVFMALQQQNFVLSNSLTNLVKEWHKHTQAQEDQDIIREAEEMFGTLFGTKDSTTT